MLNYVIHPLGEFSITKELNVVLNRNLSELGGELPTMTDMYFHLTKAIRITRERTYNMTRKGITSQTIMTNRIRTIWKLTDVARALRKRPLVKR